MDDDFENGGDAEDGRSAQVRGALLKALAVVVVIGVVIALGTTIVVRALGLNEGDSPGPVGAAPKEPAKTLPTTALPAPKAESKDAEPTEEPSESATAEAAKKRDIELDVSPIEAGPMERVNLSGSYKRADDVGLQVQRFEDGVWQDFGVDVTVHQGTYATYVQTGRPGEQRFRMYDPATKQGSNVVLVTIR